MPTISDLNPIQFWPTGSESYNEKAICGVYSECFCQLLLCDDTLITQFQMPSGGQPELRVYSEGDILLYTNLFSEIGIGAYQSELTVDVYSHILTALASWTNTDSGTDWTITSTPFVSLNSGGTSKYLTSDFTSLEGDTYEFSMNWEKTTNSGFGNMTITVALADSSNNILDSDAFVKTGTGDQSYNESISLTPSANGTRLIIRVDAVNQTPSIGQIHSLTYDGPASTTVRYFPCDEQAQFKIFDASQIGALAGFSNKDRNVIGASPTAGVAWSTGSNPASSLGGTNSSDYLLDNFPTILGNEYTFAYQANFGANGATMTLYILDSAYNVIVQSAGVYNTGVNSGSISLTPLTEGSYIAIGIDNGGVANTFTMQSLSKTTPTEIELFHSDCVDIRTSYECDLLITYDNTTDFEGMVFEAGGSPNGGPFYLRVPAQFWKEDNPEEQEDHELSNGVIVTLRQEIQEKRLLEPGYMPNYMHKKVQKVLMCDSVLIDGEYWKKRDGYESDNINRYGLKKGQVWLTDYDSVKKNTP